PRCRMCFFFFQAEDGIRDKLVTGVQTCALPILDGPGPEMHPSPECSRMRGRRASTDLRRRTCPANTADARDQRRRRGRCQRLRRSEERRVGKECRSRWWRDVVEEKGGRERGRRE